MGSWFSRPKQSKRSLKKSKKQAAVQGKVAIPLPQRRPLPVGSDHTIHTKPLLYEDYETESTPGKTSYHLLADGCGYKGKIANLQQSVQILRLKPSCELYKNILEYIDNSSGGQKVFVKQIYKITRNDQRRSFEGGEYQSRIMLWHGTERTRVPGILENGMQLAEMSARLFGHGIYFADRFAKANFYASESSINFVILADVDTGKIYKSKGILPHYSGPPEGFDTMKREGMRIPDWSQNKRLYGAFLPSGPTVSNDEDTGLPYNEYVVYNADRVVVRFIVECSTLNNNPFVPL